MINQPIEDLHQLLHVGKVQSGCRFVKHIQGFPRSILGKLKAQFHPLGFSSAQGQGTLAQLDVFKSYRDQRIDLALDFWDGVKNSLASSIVISKTS